jgi:hypothetical protein
LASNHASFSPDNNWAKRDAFLLIFPAIGSETFRVLNRHGSMNSETMTVSMIEPTEQSSQLYPKYLALQTAKLLILLKRPELDFVVHELVAWSSKMNTFLLGFEKGC